jgi:VanZ family protein
VNAGATERRQALWDRWYLRILPTYWLFLFCMTHLPRAKLPSDIPHTDWVAHFLAYALLTFLFWRFCEAISRPLSEMYVWKAAALIAIFGIVDECLQPYVGRSASVLDWLADTLGMASVLLFLEWRRRRGEVPAANGSG